jgi:hypothetical protein
MMIFPANVDPDAVRGGARVYTLLAFIYGIICFWVPICIYMMSGRVKEMRSTLRRMEAASPRINHDYSLCSGVVGFALGKKRAKRKGPMRIKELALVALLALSGCATNYQPQSFTGGYSDFLTAPDEALITFHGNGYTTADRVLAMTALRCAEVTLQHGYRYFVAVNVADLSGTSSFTTPGYAQTTGHASAFGNFATGSATTVVTPPQTYTFYKPAVQVAIRMSNNEKELEGIGIVFDGQRARPKDAAFLAQSLRAHLGIKTSA